jgi:hypothetical protein
MPTKGGYNESWMQKDKNDETKSAIDLLAEKMGKLVDQAADRMSDSQFKEAEKKSAAITSRVRACALPRDKA